MNKAREFDQSVVAELKALLGERVSTSAAVREHHGKDESYFPYALPDAVVFVRSTEEVRDVVNICRRHRVRSGDALAEQRLQLGNDGLIEFAGFVHDLF